MRQANLQCANGAIELSSSQQSHLCAETRVLRKTEMDLRSRLVERVCGAAFSNRRRSWLVRDRLFDGGRVVQPNFAEAVTREL